MSINTSNIPLSELQRIYNTQQTILGDMKDNDILLPGMSAEDFKKINEAIGKLDLEEGQPDPVGDDAAVNSPFSNVDNALGKFSQNRDMDVKGLLDTYGVTAKDALDRARSLAQYEDTLGLAVSSIGKAFGPTIGKVLETIRKDPRQTYKEMIAPLAALDYYSHEPTYDLPQPTSVGKGTRATPDTKDTFFGFNVDKNPVDPVPTDPYSPYSSEPDPVSSMTPSQQMETMSESKQSGIGESEGEEGAEQTSAEAAAASASYGGGFGGGHGPDTGMGPPDMGADMGWNTGGRVGALIQHLRTGGDVENAETNMGNANIPMGVVNDPDGAPSPFSGGTGVEDDLDMDVEAGSYVLNAESVQLIGISDINAVIRDAYSIAAALGQPMPQDYDPQNKVPIRISNGEAVIPKPLVDIIGLDKLEKWNKKGLELRKQKEKMMAQQQQAQPPQGPQVAAEAPMQQQMGQLMANGSLVEGLKQVGRGKAVDFGPLGKINIGFDLYDKESTLKAADLAGSLLGTTKEQKRNATNLMRRTAAVESDLGTGSKDINRASGDKERFTIGPFQVTKLALKDIQDRIGDPFHKGMNANIKKIKQHPRFKNVDFKTIDVDDLKDPYINAIIARLYYTTKSGDIPESLKEQAIYWKQKYNTEADKAGKASDFIKKAKIHNLL